MVLNKILFFKNTGYCGSGCGSGHGMFILNSTVTIGSSFFIQNSGSVGGGLINLGTSTTNLINSVFSGNAAYDCGANIVNNAGATINVVNTSVTGGGTFSTCQATVGLSNSGTINIANSIIWHDSYPDTFKNTGTLNAANSIIKAASPPGTAITISVSPYTVSGNYLYLNPSADTNGAAAGTSNQAINSGNSTAAGDATYGFPDRYTGSR